MTYYREVSWKFSTRFVEMMGRILCNINHMLVDSITVNVREKYTLRLFRKFDVILTVHRR